MPFTRSHLCSIACGAIFRHIEEVIEYIPDTSQTSHSSDELGPGDVPERSVNGPARPPKKRKREEDGALINVRKFRRIQLINTSIVLCPAKMSSSQYPNSKSSSSSKKERVGGFVTFVKDPVRAVSRPANAEESWAAYDFEIHAQKCAFCHDPYEVCRNHEQLCEIGHRLAQEVAVFFYNCADGETYSTTEEEGKLVRVEISASYVQVRGLLKAVEHSLRHRSRTPFVSMDRTCYAAARIPPRTRSVKVEQAPEQYSVEVREPSLRLSGYYR